MIKKSTTGSWQNSATSFGTFETWSARFVAMVETEKRTYFLDQDVLDGNYGAILSINKDNGASSFGNNRANDISAWDAEDIERKLRDGEYVEVDIPYETETERDCS